MSRQQTAEQIALLKERVTKLETLVNTLMNQPHPSDVASSWRARLKKLGSPYKVFVMDINPPNHFADGTIHIHRVTCSNPDKFLIVKNGQARGVVRRKDTIEKWISSMEDKNEIESSE